MEKNILNIDFENLWISEDQSKEEIEEKFEMFNTEMERVYQFTLSLYEYLYQKRDYGNGTPMTMLEIHVLTDVNDNPGITVTEIAGKWRRTTSAISQIIKSLFDMNLVYRVRNEQDGKINNLFITEEGKKMVLLHKHYDNVDTVKTMKTLLKSANMEEIAAFIKVAELYREIIEDRAKLYK